MVVDYADTMLVIDYKDTVSVQSTATGTRVSIVIDYADIVSRLR